ncbi:hypothetical protein [Microbacterium sp. 179-I 3D3 NHS]|uniref:hypothetical protein n=1 Tax=Microbacterium sp. 179-I 3D3 NHS TaxID=3142382 RepID=UPI0039A3A3FC
MSSSVALAICTGSALPDGGIDWTVYAREVYAHAGIAVDVTEGLIDDVAGRRAPLVFLSAPVLAEAERDAVVAWIRSGGAVITYGGAGDLGDALGVADGILVDEGYVRPAESVPGLPISHPGVYAHGGRRLDVTATTAHTLAEWADGGAAAVLVPCGEGRVEIWGADPWQSIVRIQQGWPVEGKGPAAPDGSVPRADDILRADEGLALPYSDRRLPDGSVPPAGAVYEGGRSPRVAAPIFTVPHADLWRALVGRSLADAYAELALPFVRVDYWPAGLDAVAHMSCDSDLNRDSNARAALAAFDAADVRVAWCQCHPGGYSPEVVEAITAAGHEQALHYNAMHDTDVDEWGFENMATQLAWVRNLTGATITSNKNHYTRWEGWTEFYEWCDRLGIGLDQTRGPSKQGDAGFTFGTAHLWRPLIDHEGGQELGRVIEMPLHSQDLAWFAHRTIAEPILDQAVAVHGVAHFLFHGGNIERDEETRDSVVAVAEAARARGMQWWLADRIERWERARRGVAIELDEQDDGWVLRVSSAEDISDLAVLVAGDAAVTVEADGDEVARRSVLRHGRAFTEIGLRVHAGITEFRLDVAAVGDSSVHDEATRVS